MIEKYHYFAVPVDTCYPNVCDFGSGVCFSPDSRLLYFNTLLNVWQVDMQDTTVASPFHLMQIDTAIAYFPWYDISCLGPNGKVYIGSASGLHTMPFIDKPNIRGIGCDLKSRGNGALVQPYTGLLVPPNMPHYGLGKIPGSACDTISKIDPPVVTASEDIIIPNAFSPNGDARNETWRILNIPALQLAGITLQSVGIYNRWGNEVFKSNDINFEWNGKGWASDTYYYFIRYRTNEGVSKVQKGSVNVVR
jgi:gliding motility-associated-like protein